MFKGRVRAADDASGLADVAVSDGASVVHTAADGSFEIAGDGPFVFVVRPTGWHCRHWYAALDEPGPFEFVLEPQPQTTPFSFAHLTDIHVTAHRVDAEGPAARMANLTAASEVGELLQELAAQPGRLAFVVATGDLTNHGLPEELAAFRALVDESPLPLHPVPGNHDHMNGSHDFTLSPRGYLVNLADPAGYERHLGPRWYSFDYAGTHFVALDWHTHELGIDDDAQEHWLANDLAAIDPSMPWVLLVHDQLPGGFFDRLSRRPIATFSGHWHTSRVVKVSGTLHVNTPNTFFAGLDYSAPSLRVATVGSSGLELSTTPRRSTAVPAAATRWSTELPGSVLRARPVAHRTNVIVATHEDDRARGSISAIDRETGAIAWTRAELPPMKATPCVVADAVIVVDVMGDLHCLDALTGQTRWVDLVDDALRHWGYTTPACDGTTVFAGDQRGFRAIDVASGQRRWERADLGPHLNLVSHASPVVRDDRVIVGFWPLPPTLYALSSADGSTVVAASAPPGAAMSGVAGASPVGDPLLSTDGFRLYVPAGGGTYCIDTESLQTIWHTAAPGLYNPARPILCAAGLAVVIAELGLRMLDPDTGAIRWQLDISGDGGPLACYGRAPHALLGEPAIADGRLVLGGLDGQLRVVDMNTGELVNSVGIGAPVAAAPLAEDDGVIVTTLEGTVCRIDTAVRAS